MLLSNIINQEQYIISLMFEQLHMCNLEELLFNELTSYTCYLIKNLLKKIVETKSSTI